MAENVKTVSGVAIANVKTIAGVAIANVKTIVGVDNTGGGVSYLVNESFTTGVKPTGWFDAGSPNYAYTPSIDGAYSARITTAGSQYFGYIFGDYPALWGKMRLRFDTSVPTVSFFNFTNSAFTPIFILYALNTGELLVECGGAQAQTVATVSADTDYYVWFRFAKGAGTARGEIRFATTDSKPGDGSTATAILTNGNTATDANFFQAILSASTPIVYDNIQIADSDFS